MLSRFCYCKGAKLFIIPYLLKFDTIDRTSSVKFKIELMFVQLVIHLQIRCEFSILLLQKGFIFIIHVLSNNQKIMLSWLRGQQFRLECLYVKWQQQKFGPQSFPPQLLYRYTFGPNITGPVMLGRFGYTRMAFKQVAL